MGRPALAGPLGSDVKLDPAIAQTLLPNDDIGEYIFSLEAGRPADSVERRHVVDGGGAGVGVSADAALSGRPDLSDLKGAIRGELKRQPAFDLAPDAERCGPVGCGFSGCRRRKRELTDLIDHRLACGRAKAKETHNRRGGSKASGKPSPTGRLAKAAPKQAKDRAPVEHLHT